MPKRSDPFTGAAGPGLTVMLAIAIILTVGQVLARPLMANRGSRDGGHDEAMTRISALIIACQDIGWYHIGVRAHG
jgi:hypothetical protein